MANITKKVNRAIVAPMQFWNTASDLDDDGNAIDAGDVFKIRDSIYRSAGEIVVTTTAGGSMSFRTNSLITLCPPRPAYEMGYSEMNPLVASGVSFLDASQGAVLVPGNSSVTVRGTINDVEIVTASGSFTLRAS